MNTYYPIYWRIQKMNFEEENIVEIWGYLLSTLQYLQCYKTRHL